MQRAPATIEAVELSRRLRRGAFKAMLVGARGLRWASNRLLARIQAQVSAEDAAVLTAWLYDHASRYRAAGSQHLGLHEFEKRAIKNHFPSPPCHLLVLACGGGREVLALLKDGYAVTGSDPAQSLVAAALRASGDRAQLSVGTIQGSHQLGVHGPFDGVIIGWGGWGYVLQQDSRIDALTAIRTMCPRGPVLLSWPHGRLQPVNAQSAISGVPPTWTVQTSQDWRDDLIVNPGTGFSVRLSVGDIAAEAARAGYEVIADHTSAPGYRHAVLRPCANAADPHLTSKR